MSTTLAEIRDLVAEHNLHVPIVHDNLQAGQCVCAVAIAIVEHPPQSSGNACQVCGGIMVQTGTCTTCTGCGTTGGCG